MKKRIFSVLLCAILICALLPISAFAESALDIFPDVEGDK